MNGLRQVVAGILAALLSTAIILGSLSLALTEGTRLAALAPTSTEGPPPLPSETLPAGAPTPVLSPSPSPTSGCPVPPGWVVIFIQPGDTLESLAQAYGTTPEELAEGNCITPGIRLIAGYKFSVPGLPSTTTPTETAFSTETSFPTDTPVSCGPPRGWVTYIVKRGDTLYSISRAFGITLNQLRSANCIYTDHIEPGQRLWVPNVPTRTVEPTDTPRPSDTPEPSSTPPPGPEDTPTPTATETETETLTPTLSPEPPTSTATPSATPITPTSPPATIPPPDTPSPVPENTASLETAEPTQ
jgi:LysM repeat protein